MPLECEAATVHAKAKKRNKGGKSPEEIVPTARVKKKEWELRCRWWQIASVS